jgi:transcriptional regulator with XRE-family HTH domain
MYIRRRINSGEYTERSLARVLHISQPHLHNMLKGVRQITIDFADRVMLKFRISIFDLLSDEEIFNFCEHKNPDWLAVAAKRKAAVRSNERKSDPRAPWRTGSFD